MMTPPTFVSLWPTLWLLLSLSLVYVQCFPVAPSPAAELNQWSIADINKFLEPKLNRDRRQAAPAPSPAPSAAAMLPLLLLLLSEASGSGTTGTGSSGGSGGGFIGGGGGSSSFEGRSIPMSSGVSSGASASGGFGGLGGSGGGLGGIGSLLGRRKRELLPETPVAEIGPNWRPNVRGAMADSVESVASSNPATSQMANMKLRENLLRQIQSLDRQEPSKRNFQSAFANSPIAGANNPAPLTACENSAGKRPVFG